MPRSIYEKSKSPERVSRRGRFRPSSPIEIPIRRRQNHVANANSDPPDMIFDMSPLSPSFSSLSPMHPLSGSTSSEKIIHEPFMYAIPTFRISPFGNGNGNQPRSKISRQRVMPSRNNSGTVPLGAELHKCHSASCTNLKRRRGDDTRSLFSKNNDCIMPTPSTNKITGFIPLNEDQAPSFDQTPRPTIPLNPPPRRSSYSSSPWILPGKSDAIHDDASYSQVDPAVFEFQRDLMRRLDHQNSSRFKSLHSQCF